MTDDHKSDEQEAHEAEAQGFRFPAPAEDVEAQGSRRPVRPEDVEAHGVIIESDPATDADQHGTSRTRAETPDVEAHGAIGRPPIIKGDS